MIDLRHKPVLTGEKVTLRPFETGDIDAMEECIMDPEVSKLTGSSGDFDRETLRKWYGTRNEQSDRLDLAILDQSTNTVVGETVINEYDESKHSMNFRILIGPKGRDRGLGSEATILVTDYIFSNTDLKEITLSVYSFNPRAKRVYEKAGFVTYYVELAALEHEGRLIDSVNMILSRENWEKRRGKEC